MAWQLMALAACRIAAFVLAAPLFGCQRIPWWIRLGLMLAIAAALAPLVVGSAAGEATPLSPPELVSRGLGEILVGLMLGLGASVLTSAAAMAGQILSQMVGLQWPVYEADGSSPVTKLIGLLSLVVFVLMRGPEMMLAALSQSLVDLPPGAAQVARSQLELITSLLSQSLWLCLRGVAPAVASLWIAILAVTMVSRVLPQAGSLQLGMDAGLAAMWLAVLLTVCGGMWVWMDDIEHWMVALRQQAVAAARG